MCVYWNSYVVTSTIVSRHCLCAASSNLCHIASSNLCHDPFFMSQQHFCLFLLQQCFLYCQHSYRDRKVCYDRVLLPLNLISCYNFILMLRHSLLVLLMFYVATKFLCRDRTFLYSTYICVATKFVISQQDLSPLCWNLCRDIEKSVVTLFLNVQLIFVLRP